VVKSGQTCSLSAVKISGSDSDIATAKGSASAVSCLRSATPSVSVKSCTTAGASDSEPSVVVVSRSADGGAVVVLPLPLPLLPLFDGPVSGVVLATVVRVTPGAVADGEASVVGASVTSAVVGGMVGGVVGGSVGGSVAWVVGASVGASVVVGGSVVAAPREAISGVPTITSPAVNTAASFRRMMPSFNSTGRGQDYAHGALPRHY